jgi:hypothetical protein
MPPEDLCSSGQRNRGLRGVSAILRPVPVAREQVDDAILDLAQIDYLDLWAITRLLVAEFGPDLGGDPTDVALGAVERLLARGSLRAGDLVPPGEFEPWSENPSQAIGLIRKRAADLKHPLTVGEVAWFALVD